MSSAGILHMYVYIIYMFLFSACIFGSWTYLVLVMMISLLFTAFLVEKILCKLLVRKATGSIFLSH